MKRFFFLASGLVLGITGCLPADVELADSVATFVADFLRMALAAYLV